MVGNADTARASRAGQPGRVGNIVLWVLQVLGAVSFLLAGYQKLAGTRARRAGDRRGRGLGRRRELDPAWVLGRDRR